MPNAIGFKDKLLDDLWLLMVHKCGSVLFPRTKRNKQMKLLTLTNDRDYQEVTKFEENNLTNKECVTAWTYSHIKKLRLETEISPAKVVGATRYEDSVSRSSFSIGEDFPFHIINLDFSSQDPSVETGRVEKEIKSLEHTLRLQKQTGGSDFVLIYTTVLNSNHLNYGDIVQTSNSLLVSGWPGLSMTDFPSEITDHMDKGHCIQVVLRKILSKYGYNCEIHSKHIPLESEGKYVFSVAAVVGTEGA